jgi:hypothetical protein
MAQKEFSATSATSATTKNNMRNLIKFRQRLYFIF